MSITKLMKARTDVLLSVIIPAYNEAEYIGSTLERLNDALNHAGLDSCEIIVADDESTDQTASIAQKMGAKVVTSGKRNIGATRNAGASHANGDYLLFLDADTLVSNELMVELKNTLTQNVIAGGAPVGWNGKVPFTANFLSHVWNTISKCFHLPAGSFFFVRHDAFLSVKGFDEEYYVSEELHLARKLKPLGRVIILKHSVSTSPRKVYQFTFYEHAAFFLRLFISPFRTLKNRHYLKIWYERRK